MNEIGRRAIMADPDWRGGSYAAEGVFPSRGLAIARMVGMVTYHSKESMDLRFGRNPATRPVLYPSFGPTFDVEGYLHYHGDALTKRFDANSYLYLTRAMDLYDVGRDGGEAHGCVASRPRSCSSGFAPTGYSRPGDTRVGRSPARARQRGRVSRARFAARSRRLPEGVGADDRSYRSLHKRPRLGSRCGVNIAGYGLRPPRGPKDAMPGR